MTITVNGQPAEPGCYIAGHRGQYGLDDLAEVCEQFDIEFRTADDPRHWRLVAEDPDFARYWDSPVPERSWEMHTWAADRLEELLNERTTGGYWSWKDGEFFLVQAEVDGMIWVPAEDGEEYDDVWHRLIEGDLMDSTVYQSYDDLPTGQRAFTFRITVHYEPE